jgi:hypothetical protein
MFDVIDNVFTKDCNEAAFVLEAFHDNQFGCYDNPFERKQVLQCIREGSIFDDIITILKHQLPFAQATFSYDLVPDNIEAYTAIFRYNKDAKLDVHVDAGICPENGLRKAVTVILYLNDVKEGGELEFWNGTSCMKEEVKLFTLIRKVQPKAGRMVIFENDDFAWHGMSPCNEFRAVATVSFMTKQIDMYRNTRKKAYFVPRPNEVWPEEKFVLRDKRADEKLATSVYIA